MRMTENINASEYATSDSIELCYCIILFFCVIMTALIWKIHKVSLLEKAHEQCYQIKYEWVCNSAWWQGCDFDRDFNSEHFLEDLIMLTSQHHHTNTHQGASCLKQSTYRHFFPQKMARNHKKPRWTEVENANACIDFNPSSGLKPGTLEWLSIMKAFPLLPPLILFDLGA